MMILIAFNWNYLIADWRMDSPFYLGHVTKIMLILPAFIYLITRGFLIPLKRGVSIFKLLPVRFFGILLICIIADGIKALVFTFPKKIKK